MNDKMTLGENLLGSAKGYFKRNSGILIGLFILCVVITVRSDSFLTYDNIMNVLRQIAQNTFLACVLGGCSMAGGYGFVGGTIIGALIIGVMNNGLNLMRIDSYWQMIAKGIIVLVAVYVDYIKSQKKNQKAAG